MASRAGKWTSWSALALLGGFAACSSKRLHVGDAAVAGATDAAGAGGSGSAGSVDATAGAGGSGSAGSGGATAGTGGTTEGAIDAGASDTAEAVDASGDVGDAPMDAAGFTGSFACTLVAGPLPTQSWYLAGFEADGLDGTKWEGKFQHFGYVDVWAQDPPAGFAWNAAIESACAEHPEAPDRVIFTAWNFELSAMEDVYAEKTAAAVRQFLKNFPTLKRLDLMTIIRCPGDPITLPGGIMCNPNADYGAGNGHDISKQDCHVPPTVDRALEKVATQFPGLVFVAPKFYSPTCPPSGNGSFSGASLIAVAKDIAAYYRTNP